MLAHATNEEAGLAGHAASRWWGAGRGDVCPRDQSSEPSNCGASRPPPLASDSPWQEAPIFRVPPLRPRMLWWRCCEGGSGAQAGPWGRGCPGFPPPAQGRTLRCDKQASLASCPPAPLMPHPGWRSVPRGGPAPLCPLLPSQRWSPVSPANPALLVTR